MKRKVLVKMMGSALAFAMVFGCATMTSGMTAHAITDEGGMVIPGEGDDSHKDEGGRNPGNDGPEHDEGGMVIPGDLDPDDDGSGHGPRNPGDSDSGSSETTEDLGRTESNQFNSGSAGGSSADGGSGNSSSAGRSYSGGSYDWTDIGSAGGQEIMAAGLTRSGNAIKIAGKETWRQTASASAGTFKVYHMGIERYTLQVKDADGNAVSYKGAGMLQTEDGKWYINIVTSGGIDTTGWTAATVKGTSAYLPGLGVSGVCINDAVVVDAEAVAAASAE